MAIKLKGMNRHDYNPKNGRVVSRKEIEKDIRLMKQFNINAIRTKCIIQHLLISMIYAMNMECM